MPYRVDIPDVAAAAAERLIDLGAIDVELLREGGVAAVMPDTVGPDQVAAMLGVSSLSVSPALGRDAGSVWVLRPRAVRIGRLRIAPAGGHAEPGALRLVDGAAFGTGLHPTTALCLEAIEELLETGAPDAVLDVGTGSGVLALAALMMGASRALGIDIDEGALRVSAENARINGLGDRLALKRCGPEALSGTWPLVLANVLAAPLIEMAPALVQRVGRRGHLVLSGIPSSLEQDVERVYRRLGLHRMRVMTRAGWVALVLQASW